MVSPARNPFRDLLDAAWVPPRGQAVTDRYTIVVLRCIGELPASDKNQRISDSGWQRTGGASGALLAAAGLGVPVSQHAEDTRLTGGCSMNAGRVAFRLGLRGMPVEAEARIVERDIRLLREIELMDRVRVFREGAVGAVMERARLSRAALVAAFFGQEAPA